MTKREIKLHKAAEQLLHKGNLTHDEKIEVYENWYPAYVSGKDIQRAGAFFTPYYLARDFTLEMRGKRIIDLCAGIGQLSFIYYHKLKIWEQTECEIVCIERNWEYVKTGSILFPEAKWIHGDVCDEQLIKSLGKFDFVISNPPFGNIKTSTPTNWLEYRGNEFEYKVIEIGKHLADEGAFIVPQLSAPFRYSGCPYLREGEESSKYKKFHQHTGINLQPGLGIDTSIYIDEWKGTRILTEVACVDYTDCTKQEEATEHEPHQMQLF